MGGAKVPGQHTMGFFEGLLGPSEISPPPPLMGGSRQHFVSSQHLFQADPLHSLGVLQLGNWTQLVPEKKSPKIQIQLSWDFSAKIQR